MSEFGCGSLTPKTRKKETDPVCLSTNKTKFYTTNTRTRPLTSSWGILRVFCPFPKVNRHSASISLLRRAVSLLVLRSPTHPPDCDGGVGQNLSVTIPVAVGEAEVAGSAAAGADGVEGCFQGNRLVVPWTETKLAHAMDLDEGVVELERRSQTQRLI